ncbi:MAG: ATP-binding protein [Clostridia bacterium]|nr:ATP-binding protein [Clostridia bacterium]
MLVAFSVTNYGPFSEKVGLTTLCDTSKKEQVKNTTFEEAGKKYNYVNYIYGFNGTGKSHIFKALLSMQHILALSPIIATNNQQILESSNIDYEVTSQRDYFRFKEEFRSLPTEYEIIISIDGTCYTYSFQVLDQRIISEKLLKKYKRTEILIDRKSPHFEDILLKSDLKSFELFRSTVKENVLCLSMAMFLNNSLAVRIYKAITEIIVINMTGQINNQYFEDITEDELDLYTRFIRMADSTIKKLNVSLEKEEVNKKIKLSSDFESRKFVIKNLNVDIESVHDVYKDEKLFREETLPFLQFESNGTIKLFGALPAIFKALSTGGTIFIDEIESGLHPILTKLIVELFNSSDTNSLNAQLICSSHEVYLLKENVRRDQVWFLHKNNYGESSIKRLSKFSGTRSNDDIEYKYLHGAFGEIPKFQ